MAVSETTATSRYIDDESDEDASEAQAQVIASLRAQVTDLFSQVTQLNGKLVNSYDRMSDLEDQLHDASSSLRNASVTISALELERSHHLAALNTGLLVEKAHVTAELNRLMERATEEAAQRGQAESARQDIEKDLDDLSASLFDQANTMVAEARLGQAMSERKVQEAEGALRIAEDAVKDMQVQMQSIQAAKEAAEHDAQEVRLTVSKGKWAEQDELRAGDLPSIRFMTTHTPYAEFITFIAHLRVLRVSQPTPPVISTLLSQPFLARLLTEDSEATVRLDLAPSLNWLSRRSVLTAIHTGMLIVEPWPFPTLVQELQQHHQSTSTSSLSCALCGAFIARLPSTTPVSRSNSTNGGSWFKYSLALGTPQNHDATTQSGSEPPGQVYIFRLAAASASTPPPALAPTHTFSTSMSVVGTSRPLNVISSSRVLPAQTQNSPYPLCTSNYCLTRLRSTCSLWAFVRVGIVERIWEDEPSKLRVNGNILEAPSPQTSVNTGSQPANGTIFPSAPEKPPIPPRRRRLWDMASALGEKAVNWGKESGESAKEKEKENGNGNGNDGSKKLPNPPPSHPSAPHPHVESSTSQTDTLEIPTSQANALGPPPLPKRNVVRAKATTDIVVPPSITQNGAAVPQTKESVSNMDGHMETKRADLDSSDTSLTPAEEMPSTTPPSPLPPVTSHPVTDEPGAPQAQDPSPSSPHDFPLPMTPTASNPISRVTSPAPRPRSRLSSPASPPPSSRPGSPAVGRSRAGLPTPIGISRPPSAPVSHIRGKTVSVSSHLASARPASPASTTAPGVPPVPRRAAARRAVPPPPVRDPKITEEAGKEEGVAPTVESANPNSGVHVPRSGGAEVTAETKTNCDWEGGAEVAAPSVIATETAAPQVTSELMEAAPAHVQDVTVGGVMSGLPTRASETIVSDPLLEPASVSEDEARTSMDTTGTKRSSSSESEGFANDATWEDRTWKTLVKLKEDMFWARIGGVRTPQGS